MDKKKFFSLGIILFVLIVLFIYLFVVNKEMQKKQLLIDISRYADCNLVEVEKEKVHVFGSYRKLENEIYDYILNFQKQYSKVLDYANDKELVSILAVNNYLQDGPDFIKSNQYIEKVRSDFDLDMERLLSFCSEEGLNSYVNSLNLSNSKKQLFIDVVMESGLLDNFKSYKDIFLESENHMNEVFNSVISTLAFLKNNQDKWKIEDGEIQFSTEDLVNKYNSLVNNLL